MAYYSGQASSLSELISEIVRCCEAEGYIYSNSILLKDNIHIFFEVTDIGINKNSQNVIRLVAGAGSNSSGLISPSPLGFCIGDATNTYGSNSHGMKKFPVEYNLHIFGNEAYFICKYDVDKFHWLAWGEGFISGSFGAPSTGKNAGMHSRWPMVSIDTWRGGYGGNQDSPSCAFFWNTNYHTSTWVKNYAGCIYDGSKWLKDVNAIQCLTPLMARQPASALGGSCFLPIQITQQVASNKTQILKSIEHSRFLRIDEYEPEQVISLGSDHWKIYPFYRKNSAQRNGGEDIDHTGTFGWAIRYDGP